MEIKKGQIISDQLAEILRERTSTKERKDLAKKYKMHVNSINNRIITERKPLPKESSGKKADRYVKMMYDLCKIAFRNNDSIIENAGTLKEKLKKLIG